MAEKRAQRGGFGECLVLREAPPARARLHAGGSATLIDALRREFEACAVARIAVAFVMQSGVDLLEGPARAALLRGAELRLLTTDYLGVTEPQALARLGSWHGRCHVKVYHHERRSFHPKAYLFERADGSGRAFVGSANLSRMGLVEGVEWTWTVLDVDAG
ncbi:MAG: phospholipase D-like domain-containing protein, partial [Sphaerospermopsis kisseleviana]